MKATRRSVIAAATSTEDLWCSVRRRAASGVEEAVLDLLWQRGVLEVGDLEIDGSVEQEILQLEVAVFDATVVAEAECGD